MLLAFRANEAERKMRDAIARLDLEAAIPLRDEWRRLQIEKSEAERQAALFVAERKVISIKSREPHEAAEVDRSDHTVIDLVEPEVGSTTPDDTGEQNEVRIADLALLKDMTQLVEGGMACGLLIFAGVPDPDDDGDITHVDSWTTYTVEEHLQKYLGCMTQTKHDLLTLADDYYEESDGDEE